jgi:hypothetical protein
MDVSKHKQKPHPNISKNLSLNPPCQGLTCFKKDENGCNVTWDFTLKKPCTEQTRF